MLVPETDPIARDRPVIEACIENRPIERETTVHTVYIRLSLSRLACVVYSVYSYTAYTVHDTAYTVTTFNTLPASRLPLAAPQAVVRDGRVGTVRPTAAGFLGASLDIMPRYFSRARLVRSLSSCGSSAARMTESVTEASATLSQ